MKDYNRKEIEIGDYIMWCMHRKSNFSIYYGRVQRFTRYMVCFEATDRLLRNVNPKYVVVINKDQYDEFTSK